MLQTIRSARAQHTPVPSCVQQPRSRTHHALPRVHEHASEASPVGGACCSQARYQPPHTHAFTSSQVAAPAVPRTDSLTQDHVTPMSALPGRGTSTSCSWKEGPCTWWESAGGGSPRQPSTCSWTSCTPSCCACSPRASTACLPATRATTPGACWVGPYTLNPKPFVEACRWPVVACGDSNTACPQAWAWLGLQIHWLGLAARWLASTAAVSWIPLGPGWAELWLKGMYRG